jgi:pullulanase/glycogen debranching enzyme
MRFDPAKVLLDPYGRGVVVPKNYSREAARNDAAGLYQVGSFIGDRWMEWNSRFRDDIRSFFRGDDGAVAPLADRLLGSSEIYGHKEREAEASVNFVTCHDGFTLNDLVNHSLMVIGSVWITLSLFWNRHPNRSTAASPFRVGFIPAVKPCSVPARQAAHEL